MRKLVLVLCVVPLAACATVPAGPSVMVLPGTGKSFEQFQVDDAVCRQWASHQSGDTARRAAGSSTVTGAAVGTLLGAGFGAAIGAAAGHPGLGAAVGAGGGLVTGTAIGAGAGQTAGSEVQRRYDNAYQQCMYAKGNQIQAAVRSSGRPTSFLPPPPALPPPPPGATSPSTSAAPPPNAAVPPPGTPPPSQAPPSR